MIGELLLKSGLLDQAGLARVLETQARSGGSLGRVAAALGLADESAVARAVAAGLHLEFTTLLDPIPSELAALLPPEFCHRHKVLPLGVEGRSLRLAMADPLDQGALQDVQFRTGKWVVVVVAAESPLLETLTRLHPDAGRSRAIEQLLSPLGAEGAVEEASAEDREVVGAESSAQEARQPPIVRLVNLLLTDAAESGASDVHLEPQEDGLQIRQRIDGLLLDAQRLGKEVQQQVISRLKIVAGMDIAERRKPQDGRSRLRIGDRRIDLRLSTLPTKFGEKVVVRLLDSSRVVVELDRLELASHNLERFRSLLERPQGMLLVTGPTGSGKSSTLYASLNEIKSRAKNLITVEDPIEFQMEGVSQVQINTRAGVTFAAGLRSILRQDPDIVMVGEIRDRETAAIAVEAAQTGHLLLSTLHTNDAPSSITRLLDLDVEPFMAASSIIGILAQRLVRRVCAACAVERAPDDKAARATGAGSLPGPAAWRAGRGCPACRQTGYRGRLAIHELLVVDDAIRGLIGRRAADQELREAARRAGMRTLMEDGVEKAAAGLTTLEEVARVAPRDEPRPPAVAPAREVADVSPRPEGGRRAGPKARVLVVEDSPTVVAVVRYFLELEGFEVEVAEDGLRGLEMARRRPPDIVVSDVQMPGLDGMGLTRALRGDPATRDAGILLLTSETSVEAESRGLATGADDYVAKPVEPKRLAARIHALLARRRGRQAGAA